MFQIRFPGAAIQTTSLIWYTHKNVNNLTLGVKMLMMCVRQWLYRGLATGWRMWQCQKGALKEMQSSQEPEPGTAWPALMWQNSYPVIIQLAPCVIICMQPCLSVKENNNLWRSFSFFSLQIFPTETFYFLTHHLFFKCPQILNLQFSSFCTFCLCQSPVSRIDSQI